MMFVYGTIQLACVLWIRHSASVIEANGGNAKQARVWSWVFTATATICFAVGIIGALT